MVRAGQVSKRRKTNTAAAAIIKTTRAGAIGHENLPDSVSEFDIGASRTGIVGRSVFDVLFNLLGVRARARVRVRGKRKDRRMPPKKYRPPHPMGVKGGCSPQNNF